MQTLPYEAQELLSKISRREEISGEAWLIIEKIYKEEPLTEREEEILLSPTETAAVLSIKSRRPINHRYVKELTRNFTNTETGHVTPARIKPARIVGGTFLYKTRDVLKVHIRERRKSRK